jgi:hypothetical protein
MHDELVDMSEIYLQDIVCSAVFSNPKADDFALYNIISTMTDIQSLEMTDRVLTLIKLNKTALLTT